MYAWLAEKLMGIPYVRRAVEEKADLDSLKEKPGIRVYMGLIIIGFSYLIGWPAVALFGILAVYFAEPLILLVGGPLIYGFSHVVFWVGLYLAGSKYATVFLRWAVRRLVEKLGGSMHKQK